MLNVKIKNRTVIASESNVGRCQMLLPKGCVVKVYRLPHNNTRYLLHNASNSETFFVPAENCQIIL